MLYNFYLRHISTRCIIKKILGGPLDSLEWPSSGVVGFYTTTNRLGVAAFDFTSVFSCNQLVVGPTYARGETLDLLVTDVPDIENVFCCGKHR